MNAKTGVIIVVTAAFLVVLGFVATYFAGYNSAVADYQSRAVEIQHAMAELGLVIQQQEAEQAELARQKLIAERERINAISTTDHQTAKIKALEAHLTRIVAAQTAAEPVSGSDKNNPAGRYHIFDAGVIERVWNDASGNRLPENQPAGAIQTQLPAITLGVIHPWAACGKRRRLVCTDKNQC